MSAANVTSSTPAKKRIVVICPGRGSYTKETLRYLEKAKGEASPAMRDHLIGFVKDLDEKRDLLNELTITELDSAETFKPQIHTKGEHASPLIYACSYADFQLINRDKYEIAAVCGNSMGWYLTLAFAGALSRDAAFTLIQTMGSMMKEKIIGGQIIYPIIDENWFMSESKRRTVFHHIEAVNASGAGRVELSIELGGYLVIGGDSGGLQALMKALPKEGDYPFQLINHAAFHTSLLRETSEKAFASLGQDLFQKPMLPMIDGRGAIWQPYSTRVDSLYEYTLGHQVYAPYDFTKSVTVALKEFCPDNIVLLGPGSSLGGSIGQILIQNKWQNITSKADFVERQKKDPFLLAMGLQDQRKLMR
ncbi:MAG: ACP S-malonyltransferase [Bdellovibrionota bacterium]